MHNDSLVKKLAQSVKLFAGLSHEDIREFISNCRKIEAAQGAVVIRQGLQGSEMYIIVAGSLEVQRETTLDVKVLATLQPGEVFGELAILDQLPRSATVKAASHCLLLAFERSSLVRIPNVAPKLFRNVALILSERLRETNELLSITLSEPKTRQAAEPGRHHQTRHR